MTVKSVLDLNDQSRTDEAVVVACGPSAGMYDPATINAFCSGKTTFGVNNIWNILNGDPLSCDYWTMLDQPFYDEHEAIIRVILTSQTQCKPITFFNIPNFDHYRIPIDLKWDAHRELRNAIANVTPFDRQRYFHGHSSGIAAAQVALHMGFKRIYLLGHDLAVTRDKTHGHGVRKKSELEYKYKQGLTMAAGYGLLSIHARQLGVDIVNLSPISTIKVFRRMEL